MKFHPFLLLLITAFIACTQNPNYPTVEISDKAINKDSIEKVRIIQDSIIAAQELQKKLENQKKKTADSLYAVSIKRNFKITKDEFSTNDIAWYRHKNNPKYTNRNGLFCYFMTSNGIAQNLRFCFQYYAEDWLFIENIIFNIDDRVYPYYPEKIDRDNNTDIWEWFDESVNSNSLEILKALASCKSAKLKINGRQYYKTKTVTDSQKKAIKETLALYNSMKM